MLCSVGMQKSKATFFYIAILTIGPGPLHTSARNGYPGTRDPNHYPLPGYSLDTRVPGYVT